MTRFTCIYVCEVFFISGHINILLLKLVFFFPVRTKLVETDFLVLFPVPIHGPAAKWTSGNLPLRSKSETGKVRVLLKRNHCKLCAIPINFYELLNIFFVSL